MFSEDKVNHMNLSVTDVKTTPRQPLVAQNLTLITLCQIGTAQGTVFCRLLCRPTEGSCMEVGLTRQNLYKSITN